MVSKSDLYIYHWFVIMFPFWSQEGIKSSVLFVPTPTRKPNGFDQLTRHDSIQFTTPAAIVLVAAHENHISVVGCQKGFFKL
jgi:hypothetical protein